ncbi:hypothetical protein LXM94_07600 [Rhizobium sp. TRM95111]|nr:hypothetical protein [Rhizobium alarense]MCF3639832.1 hypothetical protein [Rhizobium alarense]
MQKPERTSKIIMSACHQLRSMLGTASGEYIVIRATQLDPERYMALK